MRPARAAGSRWRHLWRWLAVALLAALPIVVPTFSLHRARARILLSLQQGLGRRVSADAVHLVLLPWPGVELDRVRLAEDPAFGIEDMVIADDARATVQLRSLLRGRLVFSSLHLDSPHINLVRDAGGRWNFAGLLNATARAPRPPGAERQAPATAARLFPYIEWSDARVNFKFGAVKERFYLDQVNGSLAREARSWRLQARFQPQRTDLNLSDTGDVTLDGRWSAGPTGFSQAPFTLSAHLAHAYLQATSALVAGHDAGVHGIVSADLQLHGSGERIEFSGNFGAQALRRWDLLPPPATIAGSFAGDYLPGNDRLELDAGDRGFQRVRLSGEVGDVLSHPRAALQLRLAALPVASMMPLVRALKSGLPAALEVSGQLNGAARISWSAADGLGGNAQIDVSPVTLGAGGDTLQLASTQLDWDGHRLAASPVAASLVPAARGSTGSKLRMSAQVDTHGYALHFAGAGFDLRAAQALAHLCGMPPFWPAALQGAANVNLQASAPWRQFRQVDWVGEAVIGDAVFAPAGGPRIPLTSAIVDYAAGEAPTVHFEADVGGDLVAGWAQAPGPNAAPAGPGEANPPPIRFHLQAARLDLGALWQLFHPSPDLFARLLGDPPWAARLNASGAVTVADLTWRDYHTAVDASLVASGGDWQARQLQLRLGTGGFRGAIGLDDGSLSVQGTATGLDLGSLLALGRYRGMMTGTLSGALQLVRAAGDDAGQVQAAGKFLVRNGTVEVPPPAAASGDGTNASMRELAFTRLTGAFALQDGVAHLTELVVAGTRAPGVSGVSWTGAGTLRLDRDFAIHLAGARGRLDLTGALPAKK